MTAYLMDKECASGKITQKEESSNGDVRVE